MTRLSVQLLTLNEEAQMAACLQSVAWADEVLVVDCFSTDNTVAICRQFPNVRVVQHAWESFGAQRQFALSQADATWVLALDADERVTPQLRAEIEQLLASDPPQAGFWVPRVNVMGPSAPVEYPPEALLRLFRRTATTFGDTGPHAAPVVQGDLGRLRHPMAHETYRNLPHFVAKTSAYAFSVAGHMAASGRRFSSPSALVHTMAAFSRKYVGKQGWRFGFRGLLWASLFANYTFLKYARLWELRQPAGAPQSSPAPEPPHDPAPAPEALAPAPPPASPPETPRPRSWLTELWPACDWKAAFILIFSVIALTFIYYHSAILGRNWRASLFSWHVLNFLVLFVVPVLVIKLIFREPLRDYGLTLGEWRVWGKWLLLFLLVFIPVAAIASRIPQFHAYYPRYRPMLSNHWLIFASMAGWLVYFSAWEFFYRGFMLFGLGKRLGAIAIFIQVMPFAMTHFPKPELESWAAIIAGVALGLMAWRSKSFVGPWLMHWLAATAMDLFVVFWPLTHVIR